MKWYDYFAEQSNWVKLVELFWEITTIPTTYEIDDEVFEYVKTYLPILDRNRYEGRSNTYPYQRLRDDSQVQHDAICLGIIASARKILWQKVSIGPWFLTFDNLLSMLSEFYSGIDKQKFGLAVQPRTWLNYLLIYSKVEFKDEDYDSIAEAILLYTVKIQDSEVTLEDYSRLIAEKLNLGADDDINILMELFLKSPLKSELERAIESREGGNADRIALKIITDVPFIDRVFAQSQLRKDNVRLIERIKELDLQYCQERAAREALERSAGQRFYIKADIKTTLDISIETQINGLFLQLNTMLPGGFQKYGLPEPPRGETKKENIKTWLTEFKNKMTSFRDITDDTRTIIENVKNILPYISYLINMMN
jgi:hypothetical protein